MVAKALKYLEKNVKPDGGVYIKGMSNYMTCLAIMAFKELNVGGKYDKVIEAAAKYVKSLPVRRRAMTEKDANFGGRRLRQARRQGPPGYVQHALSWWKPCSPPGRSSKDDPAIKRGARSTSAAVRTSKASSTTSLRREGQRR